MESFDSAEGFDRSETSTRIYRGDVPWLEQRQRELSAARGRHVTRADLLHEIITREAETARHGTT